MTRRSLALALVLCCAPAWGADGMRRVSARRFALIPTVAGAATVLTGVGLVAAGFLRADPGFQHAGWTAFGVGLGLVAVGALTCALTGLSVSATVWLSAQGQGLAAFGTW